MSGEAPPAVACTTGHLPLLSDAPLVGLRHILAGKHLHTMEVVTLYVIGESTMVSPSSDWVTSTS